MGFKGTFSKYLPECLIDFNSVELPPAPPARWSLGLFFDMFEADNVTLQCKLVEWPLEAFLGKSEK